ncbi:hypothetical protein ACVW0J_000679 [Bradyrhizobium sp. i1.7.7]
MIITGVADLAPERIRRLVYWNAFVPNNGECLNDMVPPHFIGLFEAIAAERGDSSVVLPFPIWREAFINDADLETAQRAYDVLNPHPFATFTDKIALKTNPAEMPLAKSYINCTEDVAMPHSHPWHPRLSEKLGLFRLVQVPGKPRAVLLRSGAAGQGDHGGGARLTRVRQERDDFRRLLLPPASAAQPLLVR